MNALSPFRSNRRSNRNSAATGNHRGHILRKIRGILENKLRINLHRYPISVAFAGDDLVLDGEVKNIGVKKLALDLTARFSGSAPIVDHLRVKPAKRLGDVAIRDHLIKVLLEEPALKRCLIHSRLPNQLETHRKSIPEPMGSIVAAVANGVVTLNGEVPNLAQKRLAGVLAWWTPGCRDVVNGLVTVPAQNDSDDEVTQAVRLVLEKDLLLNATKIRVSTSDRVVTLEGLVPNGAMKLMAERDSWYVVGVKNVTNKLELKW